MDSEQLTEIGLGPVVDVRGIRDFLYAHNWDGDEGRCECGWDYIDAAGKFTYDHSEHVARVLKETFDIQPRRFT